MCNSFFHTCKKCGGMKPIPITYRCSWCNEWQTLKPLSSSKLHSCPGLLDFIKNSQSTLPAGIPSPLDFFDAVHKAKENNSGKKKTKKTRIPKDALQILRDAAKTEEKPDESSSNTLIEEPENKPEVAKKKPKTHFRKTKKPGRA